jgi:hypothetical protein
MRRAARVLGTPIARAIDPCRLLVGHTRVPTSRRTDLNRSRKGNRREVRLEQFRVVLTQRESLFTVQAPVCLPLRAIW